MIGGGWCKSSKPSFVPKLTEVQMELVVADDVVDDAVRAIIGAARTGAPGDGMVFVSKVSDSYRIRTGDWEG